MKSRKKAIAHHNRPKKERSSKPALKRTIETHSMMSIIRKWTEIHGTDDFTDPEWRIIQGKGTPIPDTQKVMNPKLVGGVVDIALAYEMQNAVCDPLQTFLARLNDYTGKENRPYVEYKWLYTTKEKNVAMELCREARAYPGDDSIRAIAKLYHMTRQSIDSSGINVISDYDLSLVKRMVSNAKKFLESRGCGMWGVTLTGNVNKNYCIKGTPDWISQKEIWELKSHSYAPPKEDYLQLLGYITLAKNWSRGLFDDYKNIDLVGVYSSHSDLAYALSIDKIDKNDLNLIKNEILHIRED